MVIMSFHLVLKVWRHFAFSESFELEGTWSPFIVISHFIFKYSIVCCRLMFTPCLNSHHRRNAHVERAHLSTCNEHLFETFGQKTTSMTILAHVLNHCWCILDCDHIVPKIVLRRCIVSSIPQSKIFVLLGCLAWSWVTGLYALW